MNSSNAGARTRSRTSVAAGRWFVASGVAVAMAIVLAAAVYAPILAQTPPAPAPKAQPKAQPKAPTQQPAPTGPAAAVNAPAAPEMPPLIYTPWTKLCAKAGQEADAKTVCATSRDGFMDTGFLVVNAVLIEPEGVPTKILRVTLPLGMVLQFPARITVDQGQPVTAPYVACFPNGCIAEIEASGELIGKMKKGQGLAVGGMHVQRGPFTVSVPLAEFAKANDGQPTDPKVYEERMKKMGEQFAKKQQELQQQGH